MYFNNMNVQIELDLYKGELDGQAFFFDTPTAVELFLKEIAKDSRYKDYKIQVSYMADGENEGNFSIMDEPVDYELTVVDKMQMLRTMMVEAHIRCDCGDPYFPIIYLVVEGENGKVSKRFADHNEEEYEWWGQFFDEANAFLNSIDTTRMGHFRVYADVAPSDIWDGQYIIKSARRVYISEDSIRELAFGDLEAMAIASADMCKDDYYDLCDDLYWFTNEEAEAHKAKVFGDGYCHAVSFFSALAEDVLQHPNYVDFVTCVVEEGAASILETVDIPYSEKRIETDSIAQTAIQNTNKGPFEVDPNSNWIVGLMKSTNGLNDEKLADCGDFITVIADKEYVNSSLLEDEVLPLAERKKVVIVYIDDARFTQDRLDKLSSYMIFDTDDANRSSKINAFLSINK